MKKHLLFLIVILYASNFYAQIDPAKVVLYLPFDADASGNIMLTDESSNNSVLKKSMNAAATGDIVANSNSKFGNASGAFDKTSYLIDTKGWDNQGSGTTAFWVNFPTTNKEIMLHAQDGNDQSPGRILGEHRKEGNLGSFPGGGTLNNRDDSGDPVEITTDTWYHFAVVIDRDATSSTGNGIASLYIDGELRSITDLANPESNTNAIALGSKKTEDNQFFTGLMDDLLFTKEVLSQDQIKNLMENGVSSNLAVKRVAKNDNNLVLYKLNGQTLVYKFGDNRNRKIKSAKIYDMTGREVHSFSEPNGRLNIGNLSKGVYILRLNSEGKNSTKTFVR